MVRARTSAAHLRRVLAEFDAVAAPVLGTILVRTGRMAPRRTGAERQLENASDGASENAPDNAPATAVATVAEAEPALAPGLTTRNEHGTSDEAAATAAGHADDAGLSEAARRVVRRNHRVRARADRD